MTSGNMRDPDRTPAALLFLLVLTATFKLFNSQCIESEKQALLIFKKSLRDPANLLSSWDSATNCCKWRRVSCHNSTGHVYGLYLQSPDWGSTLGGTIDPSLSSLRRLILLDLSQNDFAGMMIPGFIGSLVSLEYLNLSSAGFKGVIPHSLGNLSSLRSLDLSGRLEVDSLQWLSSLSRLQLLNFNYVNLSKVSNWLHVMNRLPYLVELHLSDCSLGHMDPLNYANFTSLEVLDLSSNQFVSVFPTWIFHLNKLSSLQLQQNSFEGSIPSAPTGMANLRFLDLSQNNFHSALPNWLFNCSQLESLSLGINFFNGSISNLISNLRSLRSLDLSSNELSENIPWQVGQLCNLQVLELSFNRLQGNVSEFLGTTSSECILASLETLALRGNLLSGELTDQLGEFKNVQTLDLGNNSFTGPIPVSLGRLSSVQILRLDNNKLTGPLPVTFGQLSNLEVLVMENNMLEGEVTETHFENLTKLSIISASGNPLALRVPEDWMPPFQLQTILLNSWYLGIRIPTWLKTQISLSGLDLSSTGISGDIPTWIWNLSALDSMNFSHNQLSGELPDIHGVRWVYLSHNRFSGSLPFVSYSVLELDLSNNLFSGDISQVLCKNSTRMNSLTILHLGGNYLSGEIPDCWMNWPSLEVINLGNNNLSGGIPESLGQLNSLMSLNLYGNTLSGTMPSSVQNCTNLIKLDISRNALAGHIHGWIGTKLSKLRILILRSNTFTGEITSEICYLQFLHILDLADNKFSRNVPQCLDNLTAINSDNKLANSSAEIYYSYFMGVFMESASLATKGSEFQYDTILSLFSSIDLSDNRLSGHIPDTITKLSGLRSFNLSGNRVTGPIPKEIGDMKLLESLDLSRNQLSGRIPPSLSGLNFLSYLNLSYNNLSGKIPVGTQLQSFSPFSFMGNELCGLPVSINCSGEGETPGPNTEEQDGGSRDEIDWFYVCIGAGFVVGFWAICGPLIFKRSWRVVYFKYLDHIWDRIRAFLDCSI